MNLDLHPHSHGPESERMLLEQKINEVIRRIPCAPRSALQVFEAERMEQLSRAGPVPITSDLQQHLMVEFHNLSRAERGALEQRGVAAHQARIGQAYEMLRKLAPTYFRLCKDLRQPPAPHVVPSARVALFSITPPQPAQAAQPRPPHQPASPPTRPTRPGAKRPYDNLETPIPGDELDDEDENGAKPLAPTDISLEVICNNVHAVLNPATCKVVHEGREMTATQFEQFAGCGSAKKWKASLRILPGQVPECPRGAAPLQVGKWLDMRGWMAGGSRAPRMKRRAMPFAACFDAEPSPPTPPAPKAQPSATAPAAAAKPKDDEPPPWEKMQKKEFDPIKVRWSGDRCAVCSSEIDYDTDQLIPCNSCGIVVHQSCYGVRELPSEEDMWLCRACEAVQNGEPQPHCAVCPVQGGALKRCTIEGLWCHLACMQWIPELGVKDTDLMEPIQGVHKIARDRWSLQCSVCRQRCGAKIQCNKCYTAFHPLCGRIKGLTMDMREHAGGPHLPLHTVLLCHKHCTPNPGGFGVQYLSVPENGKAGRKEMKLTNGFPYTLPMPAPLPRPPLGAARLQTCKGSDQIRDGTGIGNVSRSAWWFPSQADIIRAQAEAAKARAAAGAAPKRKRGRQPSLGRPPAGPKPKGPPPQVELMEIPNGVPEQVSITCNGRNAVLDIRLQRVIYEGDEMPPSRFEQVCGKGDAKKWKATLFHFDVVDQQPTVCMQDWLAKHKLDRNALLKLKENCEGYRAWTAWEAAQAQNGAATSDAGGTSAAQNNTLQCKQEEQDTDMKGMEDPLGTNRLLGAASDLSDAAAVDAMDLDDPLKSSVSGCTDATVAHKRVTDRDNGLSQPHHDNVSEDMLGGLPDDVSAATDTTDAVLVPCPLHEANALEGELEDAEVDTELNDSEGHAGRMANDSEADQGQGAAEPGVESSGRDKLDAGRESAVNSGHIDMDSGQRSEQETAAPDTVAAVEDADTCVSDVKAEPAADDVDQASKAEPDVKPSATTSMRSGEGEVANAAAAAVKLDAEGAGTGASEEGGATQEPTDDVIALPCGAWKARVGSLVPLASEFCRLSYEYKAQQAISCLRDALGTPVGSKDPVALLGKPVRVFWPDDGVWYTAEIISWHPETKTHTLLYHDDDDEEKLDLEEEDKAGRLQWLHGASSTEWSTIPVPRIRGNNTFGGPLQAAHRPLTDAAPVGGLAGPTYDSSANGLSAVPSTAQGGVERPTKTETGEPIPQGHLSMGWRVEVFWEESQTWFKGVVESYDKNVERHRVVFDDSEQQWVDFSLYPVKWLKPDAREEAAVARQEHAAKARALADEALAKAQAEAAERAQNAPDQVRIVCNNHYAQLLVRQTTVITDSGQRLSPTEFERMSGKGAAKKWKGSIRVVEDDGSTGVTVGDWLIKMGLDINRSALAAPGAVVSRRRFANRRTTTAYSSNPAVAALKDPGPAASSGGGGIAARPVHRKRHRPDCTCIICKQARRKGGMVGGGPDDAATQAPTTILGPGPATTSQPKGRPEFRTGKNAYVDSTPYVPRGPAGPGQPTFTTPASRSWHPEEWAIFHRLRCDVELLRQAAEAAAAVEEEDAEQTDASDDARAAQPTLEAVPAVDDALVLALQSPHPQSTLPKVVEQGMLVKLGVQPPEDRKGPWRLGISSLRDKVSMCLHTERERLTINKSGIHGWGLTALQDIPQDSMVIEYRGEGLRPALQDVKEQAYQNKGVDVYLFALTETVVVDATEAGSIARFTNACCEPCLYSKIIESDGKPYLMFFAKSDIKAGQEITYDYRFRAQEGQSLTPCLCGAPGCRGTLEISL